MGAPGVSWMEAREAASHPVAHRTPSLPRKAKVESPMQVSWLSADSLGCVLNARVDVGYRPAAPPTPREGIMGEDPRRRSGLRCLAGSTQAPFRTASYVSLSGLTHFQRSGEQRFLWVLSPGSCPAGSKQGSRPETRPGKPCVLFTGSRKVPKSPGSSKCMLEPE